VERESDNCAAQSRHRLLQCLLDAFAREVFLAVPSAAKQREKRPLVEQIQIHLLAIEQRKKTGQSGAATIIFCKLPGCRGHFLWGNSSLHRSHTDLFWRPWILKTGALPKRKETGRGMHRIFEIDYLRHYPIIVSRRRPARTANG
jgi:hypothetical protein